jgi:hypothetical protein
LLTFSSKWIGPSSRFGIVLATKTFLWTIGIGRWNITLWIWWIFWTRRSWSKHILWNRWEASWSTL